MKQWNNKYNSFNSSKALVHASYWKQGIEKNIIPPPVFVSVDPCGICNFKCGHCNAARILQDKNDIMSIQMIDKFIDTCVNWNSKSICVGGGGEPTLNPNVYYLIDKCVDANFQVALVSNGYNLSNDKMGTIKRCTYMGISVDSATPQTFAKVKGISPKGFSKVLDNISKICNNGLQVCYKFLLMPSNYSEVYQACKIAKQIGCDLIHMRPGSDPWFKDIDMNFTEQMVKSVERQVQQARADFEDQHFKIFAITAKFDQHLWKPKLTFEKCWACYTTCYVSSDGTIGVCCDRRGDKSIQIGNITDAVNPWGSQKHRQIHQTVDVNKCPRCTFCHVNEIYENVILNDKMFYNFF